MTDAIRLTWAELSAAVDAILADLAKPDVYADAAEAFREGFAEGMAQAEADAAQSQPNQ